MDGGSGTQSNLEASLQPTVMIGFMLQDIRVWIPPDLFSSYRYALLGRALFVGLYVRLTSEPSQEALKYMTGGLRSAITRFCNRKCYMKYTDSGFSRPVH